KRLKNTPIVVHLLFLGCHETPFLKGEEGLNSQHQIVPGRHVETFCKRAAKIGSLQRRSVDEKKLIMGSGQDEEKENAPEATSSNQVPGCYTVTLMGNFIILYLVFSDQRLHFPMYYFLCNLAAMEGHTSLLTLNVVLTDTYTSYLPPSTLHYNYAQTDVYSAYSWSVAWIIFHHCLSFYF
ncbi:unnamed protein product, partial [Ranitomeya imitator]